MNLPEITDDEFMDAKMAFVQPSAKALQWMAAIAVILMRQHKEDPNGIEVKLESVTMRVTLEGYSDDDDSGEEE